MCVVATLDGFIGSYPGQGASPCCSHGSVHSPYLKIIEDCSFSVFPSDGIRLPRRVNAEHDTAPVSYHPMMT